MDLPSPEVNLSTNRPIPFFPNYVEQAPPLFSQGDMLGNNLQVLEVIRDGRKSQIVSAKEINNADEPSVIRVVKIMRITQVGSKALLSHLNWLKSTVPADGRSNMLSDFSDGDFHFMIFAKQTVTLRSVLSDDTMNPLTMSHIQEIAAQVIKAVSFIHRQGRIHGDIKPENIEFLNPARLRQSFYCSESSEFTEKTILASTKLQVAYYGDWGLRGALPGTDQYRPPEFVFGGRAMGGSDSFSIGCVIAEMALGEPLFIKCEEYSSLYRNEKALMYDAVSGRFTERMASRIEMVYPCTMDMEEIRPILCNGISEEVKSFITNSATMRYIFEENDPAIADVVWPLIRTDIRARCTLENTLCSDFFNKKYW